MLSDQEKEEGFVLLFDGKTLNGWTATGENHFRVEDGILIADGSLGGGMLYYTGDVGNHAFKQFEIRMQVLTTAGANSGIYFLTDSQERGYPDATGYEAQIANTHKNPRKTGSLYKIVNVSDPPCRDDEWFDYAIRVEGPVITIRVNGETVVEHDTATGGRKPHSNAIGIQCHRPAAVKFRSIRIKKLGGGG
jgi:hypothetical protein